MALTVALPIPEEAPVTNAVMPYRVNELIQTPDLLICRALLINLPHAKGDNIVWYALLVAGKPDHTGYISLSML